MNEVAESVGNQDVTHSNHFTWDGTGMLRIPSPNRELGISLPRFNIQGLLIVVAGLALVAASWNCLTSGTVTSPTEVTQQQAAVQVSNLTVGQSVTCSFNFNKGIEVWENGVMIAVMTKVSKLQGTVIITGDTTYIGVSGETLHNSGGELHDNAIFTGLYNSKTYLIPVSAPELNFNANCN